MKKLISPRLYLSFVKVLLAFAIVVLFGCIGSAWAAPLIPYDTHIDASISGYVDIGGPYCSADYYQGGHLSEFTSGGTLLTASVTTGNLPGFEHSGTVGSSAGVGFEQIAYNEYLLTLTSTATGELFKTETQVFDSGRLDGLSSVEVESRFLVLGLPGQQDDAVATILLELEHFGILSSVNNSQAANEAFLNVCAPGPGEDFFYDSALYTPDLWTDEFQQSEFIGTRDITEAWSIVTFVGETISLSAGFDSAVSASLDYPDAFNYVSANSDFDSGIRLHMTVLPEPTTVALLGLGGIALLRKRKK